MTQNRDSEINNAFFGGVIGLSAVFFGIKDMIVGGSNVLFFISLIMVFLSVSILRVFGTILGAKNVNDFAVDIFSFLAVPYTVYVAIRILITQILGMGDTTLNVLPILFFTLTLLLVIQGKLEIKIIIGKLEEQKNNNPS